MALSNAELTDELKDLKRRVRELEATVETLKWEMLAAKLNEKEAVTGG